MANKFIPVCEPTLKGNEKKYVIECLDTNWISSAGSFVERFEHSFATFCGVNHGISCTNGTTALHLAMLALEIGPDDEVILPSYTMVASLLSILYVGAKPVFVDVEPDTGNLDPQLLVQAITQKTKAIMVVHLFGHPVDMELVWQIAREKNLYVIEDAAEAHGAKYKGKTTGSLGDIACFSFFGNKIITTGEGGMVVTDSSYLADKVKYYKNLCFPLNGPRNYQHEDVGYNYRLTNIQAALGLAQLEQIETFIHARRNNAKLYNQKLKSVKGLRLPVEKDYAFNVYWMYTIYVHKKDFGISRDELMDNLAKAGIQTRKVFYPMHQQPLLKKYDLQTQNSLPVSEELSETGLYLPSSSHLTAKEIDYIVDQIKLNQKG